MENQHCEKEIQLAESEEISKRETSNIDTIQEMPAVASLIPTEMSSHSNIDKPIIIKQEKLEPSASNNICPTSENMEENQKQQVHETDRDNSKIKLEIISDITLTESNLSLISNSCNIKLPDLVEIGHNNTVVSKNIEEDTKAVVENNKSSGLALIADYSGDSEDSDSSSESSMEESSSSSSSSDDELDISIRKTKISKPQNNGFTCNKFRKIKKEYLSDSSDMEVESDSSVDSEKFRSALFSTDIESPTRLSRVNLGPRTKGEFRLCDLPPIENLLISIPEQECIEMGTVSAIVEELVVIQALREMPALNIDSILFLNKGQDTLGKIFDVFGPVNEPCYAVRFNSMEEITAKNIVSGTKVYCAPRTQHSTFVLVSDLMKVKGTDASWKEDNEPPDNHVEFSDDEEEKRWRAKRRNRPAADESAVDFEKRKNQRNLQLNAHFKRQQYKAPNPHVAHNNYWSQPYGHMGHVGYMNANNQANNWQHPVMHSWFSMPPPPPPGQEAQGTSSQFPDGNANSFPVYYDYSKPTSSQN